MFLSWLHRKSDCNLSWFSWTTFKSGSSLLQLREWWQCPWRRNMCAPEVGDSSHMTWLESDSNCKFEDLRLAWVTLIKDLTWLWHGIHGLRLYLELRQMTRKDLTFFKLNIWFFQDNEKLRFVFETCNARKPGNLLGCRSPAEANIRRSYHGGG